jgi:periplasmic protein TonB
MYPENFSITNTLVFQKIKFCGKALKRCLNSKQLTMDSKQILTADVLDIIFEGRNKAYGAYELRKTYNKRILTALAFTGTLIALLYSGYLLAGDTIQQHTPLIGDEIELQKVDEKKPEEPEIIQPKQKEPEQVKQIHVTPPLIVPNDQVPEDETPPTQEEMETAKIGLLNIDGVEDKGITAPPFKDGDRGIIAAPEKPADDPDGFVPVEIEAQYPGGTSSWTRFLIKTLSNYPAEAIEKGIQGTVVVKFIVDREGNISEVEAASGPEELRETAIKAIKKSGKWIPAQQNGRFVKSYKMQPITFRMTE